MYWKKIIAQTLCVITLLFSLHSFTVKAASPVSFFSNVDVSKAEIFYTITVSENSSICGLTLNITYDPTQVKLLNHRIGSVVSSGITKCNADISGKVILSYISTESIVKSGEVITLLFKPLTSDPNKLYISYEISECIDVNCNEIFVTPDIVTVTNPIYQKPETTTIKDDNQTTSEKHETSANKDENQASTEKISSNDADSYLNSNDKHYDNNDSSYSQTLKEKEADKDSKSEETSSVEEQVDPAMKKNQLKFLTPILSGVGILLFTAVVCIFILKIRRKKK